jgi:sigma-B regulation protein RsbU (phosphoserine phosphatase)
MTKKLKIISVVLFLALMCANIAANFYQTIAEQFAYSQRSWEAKEEDGKPIIWTVDADGPAAVLRVGDEVVSLNVEPPGACRLINRRMCAARPGTTYKLTVRRGGQTLEFDLATAANPLGGWFFDLALHLVSLVFPLTGLAVFLLKPDNKQAWLLALMLGSFTSLITGGIPLAPTWLESIARFARFFHIAFFPLCLHFFLFFPERGPWARRFPRLEFWIYLPFLSVMFPFIAIVRLGGEDILAKVPGIKVIGQLIYPFAIGYLIAGLAALIFCYWAADANNKRRTRVVVAGCGIGILTLLIALGGGWYRFNLKYPEFFDLITYFYPVAFLLIPLSFVYAIVRHQVIPVSLIIRRSARYVLVSRGAILLDVIAVGFSVAAVLTYIFNRIRPPVIVIGLVSAAVGVVTWKVAGGLHDRYLRPLIDRRFFRQSYDAHQIIAELTGELRTVTGLPQLLELVSTKIQTALQTVNVTIFLRDQTTGNYRSAYSRDYSEADGRAISRERHSILPYYAGLLKQMSDNGEPLDIQRHFSGAQQGSDNGKLRDAENGATINPISSTSPADPVSPIHPINKSNMKEDEMEALQEVKATLLMPLASKDELLGFISLGPRLGDLPFSREDKQLLMSVSGPTAFAIENARLVEQMVDEARRLQEIEVDHRRKTEELAFARQLQLSMLPTSNVSRDNIEIIGQMRTATEVGGDYYDFIEMADGRICVAVGDATGHGMAAGLVVGMVKMGLIHALQGGLQRANGGASVKPLIEDLNRSLTRSLSRRGMGMCLGAAILDASTLKVEVVSNGMPAPYHYRAVSHSLSVIETQAPPLGFLRQVNVRPVEARLAPGDALIWLSDGFEERMNYANQIWGSEQVERTLERVCGEETSAENIARRMIDACDDAAGGRSNDDDMTIVVARVKLR